MQYRFGKIMIYLPISELEIDPSLRKNKKIEETTIDQSDEDDDF